MSVLFDIRGANWPQDRDDCCLPPAAMYVQLSNDNAATFLIWIGLKGSKLEGEMPARELRPFFDADFGRLAEVSMTQANGLRSDPAPAERHISTFGRPAGCLAE